LDGDTASRHDRSERVSRDIEQEVPIDETLDLVAPRFSADMHLARERIELDYGPLVFRGPFIFEGVDGPEIQVARFDIHAFLVDGLNVLNRLNDFRSDLAH